MLTFDASKYDPWAGFDPLPEGWYKVAIAASNIKVASTGKGSYLELKLTVLEGQFKDRVIFDVLNIYNESADAVENAFKRLSAICRCVGVASFQSQEVPDHVAPALHNLPFQVQVSVSQGAKGPRNNVVKYKDANGNDPVKGAAGGAPQHAGGFQPPGAPPPAFQPPQGGPPPGFQPPGQPPGYPPQPGPAPFAPPAGGPSPGYPPQPQPGQPPGTPGGWPQQGAPQPQGGPPPGYAPQPQPQPGPAFQPPQPAPQPAAGGWPQPGAAPQPQPGAPYPQPGAPPQAWGPPQPQPGQPPAGPAPWGPPAV